MGVKILHEVQKVQVGSGGMTNSKSLVKIRVGQMAASIRAF